MNRLRRRTNQANRRGESWQPPAFGSPSTALARGAALIRRLLDLQAASIWTDLGQELPNWRGTVVDVGCGAQPYRALLHEEVHYIGIDSADAKHFGYDVPDTVYFEGTQWPLADQTADAILATETLEHIPDPAVFLAEAARVLKAGGWLLLTVPFAARYHYIPHDYWRYTPAGLQRLLDAAGFTGCEIFARGNAVTVACYKAMALILPLLMPQNRGVITSLFLRLIGLLFAPALIALALVAHISLRGDGGDDCLGYTVLARRQNPKD